jgi:hypothetical protein
MGGMMFGNTVPIAKDEVGPTLESFQSEVLDPIGVPEHVRLGSTGKKAFSGDLDVAVVLPVGMDKKAFVRAMSAVPVLGPSNVRMAGSIVSASYPIIGGDKRVQIDVMFSPSPDLRGIGWLMAGAGDGAIRGSYRNLLLSWAAKQASEAWGTKLTVSLPGGVQDPEAGGERTMDPIRILEILSIDATPQEASNFEGLVAALGRDSKWRRILSDPERGFERYMERYLTDPATKDQAMMALNALHRALNEERDYAMKRTIMEQARRIKHQNIDVARESKTNGFGANRMTRMLITEKKLLRIIAEVLNSSHSNYVTPDYANARNSREKWHMVVKHIGDALWGEGHDPNELKVLSRDKSYSGLTAAFGFSAHSVQHINEERIRLALQDAFGEINVTAKGPGPEPELLSKKYKTWFIRLPSGEIFRALFAIKMEKRTTHDARMSPKYHGHGAEGDQINAMNDAIMQAIGEGTEGIAIDLGGRIIENVGAVISQPGVPKADAYFAPMRNGVVDNQEPLAYISLKNARNPSDMNQWGGVSRYMSNSEVVNFVKRLKKTLEANPGINANEFPPGMSYRSLEPLSEEFAQKICWGPDWMPGEQGGPNAVDMIYVCPASSVKLESAGRAYRFVGVMTLYDGQVPPGKWKPYLWARRGDRNDAGIKNCRIGVFPEEYRGSRFEVI